MKSQREIGIITYLSKYISREVLDQVYKLYIRPHLDYGDIIYHLEFTKKLEQNQYSAALVVTDWCVEGYKQTETLRGTGLGNFASKDGVEDYIIFSLNKSKLQENLFVEIGNECQLAYNLRNPYAYEQPRARTVRY